MWLGNNSHEWSGMPSGKPALVNLCTLKGSLSLMLRRSARQMVIQITGCAHNNHINIENGDACCEQQGKAESFSSSTHCLDTFLDLFSNWGSSVPRRVAGYRPLSTAIAALSGIVG